MTEAQYEVRNESPENAALIASRTEEGFRVYSLENPSKVYLVLICYSVTRTSLCEHSGHSIDSLFSIFIIQVIFGQQKRSFTNDTSPLMPENYTGEIDDDIIERYDRAHARLKELLGPLYEQKDLQGAFSFNSNPEKILDELERKLDGRRPHERDEIRRQWIDDHLLDLR